MNALLQFRANGLGNMTATRAQRNAAAEEVASNLRAKLLGALDRASAKSNVSTTTAAKDAAAEAAAPGSELDRDAFLQLLVMQMQNQDPLEPVDNSQMIAQLAQFSSLEQMENLNSSFEDLSGRMEFLVGNTDQLNFISAQSLLGRYVEGITADGELTAGFVESVTLEGSIVILSVDGELMPMTGVLGIGSEAPDSVSEPGAKAGK